MIGWGKIEEEKQSKERRRIAESCRLHEDGCMLSWFLFLNAWEPLPWCILPESDKERYKKEST